jgi:hypothetical protein
MRTKSPDRRTSLRSASGREGFALPAALAVLILLSVLVVTVYANAMASFRSGTTDMGKARSHFAAEAGAESAMAQLAVMLEDAVLEDAELTTITTPTMTGFQFDSFSIVKVGTVQNERITDGPFAGLYSLTQMVDIFSEASDPLNNSSAVMVTAKAQAIPIFQFGVFYERDLEIHNGANMWFAGWVHSNGTIYLNSGARQYFEDLITTPDSVIWDRKDSHAVNNGTYIDDAVGTDVLLQFDSRSEPVANDFRARSDTDFDNRLQTEAYQVDTLRVPLPSGVAPAVVLEERLPGTDGPLEIQAKMSWKSDWYIEVPLDLLADPTDLCDEIIQTRDDVSKVLPSSSECEDIFTLQHNAFYDYKEGTYVDVINVDMSELFSWTGTDATRITNILYIWFSGTTGGDYPAVRIADGDALGNPFTIATKHPMYVWGDYNDSGWEPSALMSDGITLLSNSWVDSQHQPGGTGGSLSGATTSRYYMAVLAGHTPTPCDHEVPGCTVTPADYGGGLENYLRFLENWSGDTALYRGSLVSLHYSLSADGQWSYGYYYTAPTRDWAFDTRFEDPANLPPGTPVVGNVIHTAFRPVY